MRVCRAGRGSRAASLSLTCRWSGTATVLDAPDASLTLEKLLTTGCRFPCSKGFTVEGVQPPVLVAKENVYSAESLGSFGNFAARAVGFSVRMIRLLSVKVRGTGCPSILTPSEIHIHF